LTFSPRTVAVTVGSGGAKGATANTSGAKGGNSSIGSLIVAEGGGGGIGVFNTNGLNGGSGGGASNGTTNVGGHSTAGQGKNGGAGATLSFSGSASPSYNDSLLFMIVGGALSGGGTGTTSSYTISGTNPSWTEVLDTSVDSGTRDPISGAAYATLTTARTITSFGATLSDTRTDRGGVLVAIKPLTNVTVSPDPVVLTAAMPAPTPTGGANIAPVTVTVTATVQSSTGSTPTPKWVNKDKTTPGSVTNLAKS
jgi:hypothetical protein